MTQEDLQLEKELASKKERLNLVFAVIFFVALGSGFSLNWFMYLEQGGYFGGFIAVSVLAVVVSVLVSERGSDLSIAFGGGFSTYCIYSAFQSISYELPVDFYIVAALALVEFSLVFGLTKLFLSKHRKYEKLDPRKGNFVDTSVLRWPDPKLRRGLVYYIQDSLNKERKGRFDYDNEKREFWFSDINSDDLIEPKKVARLSGS